jgi:hypothetical protein
MTDALAAMISRREEADPRPARAVRVIPPCSMEGESVVGAESEHPFEAFRHTTFHPTTTFSARLSMASDRIQAQVDRLPTLFVPRVQVTTLLTLEELALLLPPAEQRLLVHAQSGAPLDALLGTPGFRSRKRRDDRLRLLLSRIAVYCGRVAHRRFVRRYLGKRRRGRPRTLVPRERLPQVLLLRPALLRCPEPRLAGGHRTESGIRAATESRTAAPRTQGTPASRFDPAAVRSESPKLTIPEHAETVALGFSSHCVRRAAIHVAFAPAWRVRADRSSGA